MTKYIEKQAATIDEAVQRAGSKAGNKGSEAAAAALEMINVMRQLKN